MMGHQISLGKMEGTNGMIKTLRRAGFGYCDDEYFFLKIFDSSRRYPPGREVVAKWCLPTGFWLEPRQTTPRIS